MKKETFIVVVASLFVMLYSAQSKPKDYNLAKELYFNPKLPYSKIVNDIETAGYRIIDVDTTGGSTNIQYSIYRKLFGLTPEKVSFTILNDTITKITILSDINNTDKIHILDKFVKNLYKNYTIDATPSYDKETCGTEFKLRNEIVLRYEIISIYIPIDLENTYLKIIIFPQIPLGKDMEELYNEIDKAIKKPHKNKKR